VDDDDGEYQRDQISEYEPALRKHLGSGGLVEVTRQPERAVSKLACN
jgi:hypothetical protein